MTRSTNCEKLQRLNRAFELLAEKSTISHVTKTLVKQFGISPRQASRYLQVAQHMGHPAPVAEPTIPITIKIPRDVVLKLRSYAQTSNLTIGEIVTHGVLTFLIAKGYHG